MSDPTGNALPQIEWVQGNHTTTGSLGGISIWSISWHTRRDSPDWVLRCTLPGIRQIAECATTDEAKARAQRQLAAFLKKIGVLDQERPDE